ncbi:hypothetical protein KFU94_00115 [Chloroflexi bacterium TSY]|nr:hypothetical protein [Chloroflexi bacterium TSY]
MAEQFAFAHAARIFDGQDAGLVVAGEEVFEEFAFEVAVDKFSGVKFFFGHDGFGLAAR